MRYVNSFETSSLKNVLKLKGCETVNQMEIMQKFHNDFDEIEEAMSQIDTNILTINNMDNMAEEMNDDDLEDMDIVTSEIDAELENVGLGIPLALLEEYQKAMDEILPDRSAKRYLQAYDVFLKWQSSRGNSKIVNLGAEICFVVENAKLLQVFLRYMQVAEPLVHKMQSLLSETLLKLLGRIAKPASIARTTNITNDSFEAQHLLPVGEINLGKDVIDALKGCKDVEALKFKLQVQKHFKAIALHILKKTSYNNPIIKCLQYISPDHILDPVSAENFVKLSGLLPINVSPCLIDEWSLLKATVQIEQKTDFKGRIDTYWQQFFDSKGIDNSPKFPNVSKLVKFALTISHGSVDAERGISTSGLILTDDKTQMKVRTLNARLNIKSGLSLFFDNKVTLVPIDKNFIISARRARQNYTLYMEECKRKEDKLYKKELLKETLETERIAKVKEIESKKNDIDNLESFLKEKEAQSQHNASLLLDEANERLKIAIKNKNFNEINLAQGMIEGAKVLVHKETENTKEILQLKNQVVKKKSALIDQYFKKQ